MVSQNGPPVAQPMAADRLLDVVRGAVDPIRVGAGELVVRQGDEGRRLYVVESGALDVVVTAGEGLRLPVARLGPGDHFGEMSLLAGIPVSADVVAAEPSVLYAVSAEDFDRLLRHDPDLMALLARELALRLKRTNERLSDQQQRQAALGKLIGAPAGHPFTTDLPSLGSKLREAIARASSSQAPLLIIGEDGVGKRALAQHIHAQGSRADRVVLVVDCGELPPEDAGKQLFGDASPEAVTRFADQLGYLQAADGGTLVLAHVDRLPVEVREDLATFLRAQGATLSDARVEVRVIATSSQSPEEAGGELGACPPLREALTEEPALALSPLRKRRRDILPLAELFLAVAAQRTWQTPKRLGEDARRELLGYDFAFGNVAELKQVMQLAGRLAEGDTVGAEHLFFGPTGETEAAQLDLLRWPWLERAVAKGALLRVAKGAVALAFAGIVAACLLAPSLPAGRIANVMVWGLWWPGLVVTLLLFGRAWCAVCPLSTAAEGVQRAAGLEREAPAFLKHAGPGLALVGFVAIVWAEQAAHMTWYPVRTAILLLTLAATAVVFGWLYQRHAWCRYVCPLGAMGAVLSVGSALRVKARKEVCGASCTGHECYKGSEQAPGCPMFSHALYLTSGQHCKLCLACLRSCPSRSPRLVLQLPMRDISQSNLITAEMAPVAVVVGLVSLLLATSRTTGAGPAAGISWFTAGCVAAIGVGLALTRLFRQREQSDSSRDLSSTARVIYAYAPAAAALLLAFHLRALPWLGQTQFELLTPGHHTFSISLLNLVQWTGAAVGGMMTAWALWPLCRRRAVERPLTGLVTWAALVVLAAVGLMEACKALS